jgi:hypothetical protein
MGIFDTGSLSNITLYKDSLEAFLLRIVIVGELRERNRIRRNYR